MNSYVNNCKKESIDYVTTSVRYLCKVIYGTYRFSIINRNGKMTSSGSIQCRSFFPAETAD